MPDISNNSGIYIPSVPCYNGYMMNDYRLAGSEALSEEYNDLSDYYSDVHKEEYGFRPRNILGCACDYADHAALVEGMSHLRRLVDGLHARLRATEEFPKL